MRLVYRVKESDNKMDELCDLNDPIDRREKIKMFEKEHRNVIKEIDKEFDRLNQFNDGDTPLDVAIKTNSQI